MLKKIFFILPVLLLLFSTVKSQPSVALVAAESDTWLADVQSKLIATGEFSTVDYLPSGTVTPTIEDLEAYDVVFLWSQNAFLDTDALGDNLAAYIDGGGSVVSAVFSFAEGITIGGAFATNYRLIEPATSITGQQTLGTKVIPEHPILSQVSSFDGGTSSFRANSTAYSGDLVAEWSDGLPLIVAQDHVGPLNAKRVDLNFWPVSSDGYSGGWVATTDGIKIIVNALLWTVDSFEKVLTGDLVSEAYNSYSVLWADYDLDGYPDLFIPNRDGANHLYHNNGDGTFDSVVAGDLGADTNTSFGGAWGDYDNDGDPDLFVANGGFSLVQNNSLYENNGDGTFTLITAGDLGLDNIGSISGSWTDYDLDGHLDLVVTNYNIAVPNYLYHNNGDGTFTRITTFFTSDLGYSWEAVWGDFNSDMRPDLYITNSGQANFLYRNNGAGSFTKITTGDPVIDIATTYGASWIDFDGDNDLDLYVPVNGGNNFLYVNDGQGNFIKNTTNPIVTEPGDSWSAAWGDYNNDGLVDLYLGQEFSPSALFENIGGGDFVKISSTVVAHDNHGTLGAAWADYDNDGDLDLYVSNYNAVNFLYKNNIENNNHWVDISLNGIVSNSHGVGSKIFIKDSNGKIQFVENSTVNGRGQTDHIHIGLGDASAEKIYVQWPSGLFQAVDPSDDHDITVEEYATITNLPNILLIAAEGSSNVTDVQKKLIKSDKFEFIQYFPAQSLTPSIETMESYDAAFVWSDNPFNDPDLLGDNLADYIDDGGKVVTSVFALNSSYNIGGRYATDYSLISAGSITSGQAYLGNILAPDHPIMNGVESFDGGSASFRSSGSVATGDIIAEWDDGLPLIVAKEGVGASGVKRVDLNFWPVSSDVYATNWVSSTDGEQIMTNALLWTLMPEIGSEDFPEFYDKNGGTQQASISIGENRAIYSVDVAYVGISQPPEDLQYTEAGTTDGANYTFDLSTVNDIGETIGLAYRFIITDLGGNEITSNVGITHLEYTGSNTPTMPNLKFGSTETSYQIVSIPLELNSNNVNSVFADDLGELDNTKWRIFHYENGSTNELSGTSSIDIDEGYWLIAKNNATVDVGEGSTPQVTKANPFQLNLSSGWNQIGNPYNFTISWQDVLDYNGNPSEVDTELTVYNGGFSTSDQLGRFKGAFVFSSSDITLAVPVIKNNSLSGGRKAATEENPIDKKNWSVDLELESNGMTNSLGGIGMNEQASNTEKDKFDRLTVPRFIKYLEMNMDDQAYQGNAFSKSVVPSADNNVWEFTVASNMDQQEVIINWDNAYWGDSDKQLVLFDKVSQKSINMRETTSYAFTYYGDRKFEILYGDPDFIQEKLTPNTIEIGKAHPNPFTDRSTILFTIPADDVYSVKLTIYNQLGAVVKVISQEGLGAGYHQIDWDGTNYQGVKASSGIYFGQMDVINSRNSTRFSQRLILK